MTAEALWNEYVLAHPAYKDAPYEAWPFGSSTPDALAELTFSGVKTATASAYPFYEYEHCPLPEAGAHSVILKENGEALCIIRDEKVAVVPFLEVTAEHAWKEGEGDRSLAFWRQVHEEVFTMELREIGETFSRDMLVVCEEYRVVYPEQ